MWLACAGKPPNQDEQSLGQNEQSLEKVKNQDPGQQVYRVFDRLHDETQVASVLREDIQDACHDDRGNGKEQEKPNEDQE